MLSVRGGVKGGYFSVSLTVSNLPPPPLHCSFDLTLWVKVFWKRFCTRKRQLSSNYWNPQFLLLMLQPSRSSFARGRPLRMTIWKRTVPLDHHLQEAGPSLWQPQKRHEKCIFETLHNETKCVLSVKESNFNEKKDQNFHICLWSGLRWLTSPSLYGQPDRKISVFFDASHMNKKITCVRLRTIKIDKIYVFHIWKVIILFYICNAALMKRMNSLSYLDESW